MCDNCTTESEYVACAFASSHAYVTTSDQALPVKVAIDAFSIFEHFLLIHLYKSHY